MDGNKSPIDVGWLEINEQDTVYLPNGIGVLFPNLTMLEIENSRVWFVERSNFAKMNKLSLFYLTSNPIANIPFDSFYDLKSLQDLDISSCQLTKLHSRLLETNQELKAFNISDNRLETLPSKLFKKNIKLEIVFATNNRLKFISGQLFSNLINIQFIDFSQNDIQNISANAFRDLKALRTISLSNNKLKSLDGDLFTENKRLEWARVEYNQIEEFLPGLFQKQSKMIAIGMNHNRVKIFHRKFFFLLKKFSIGFIICFPCCLFTGAMTQAFCSLLEYKAGLSTAFHKCLLIREVFKSNDSEVLVSSLFDFKMLRTFATKFKR